MNYSARFPAESTQKKFLKGLDLLPDKMQAEIWNAIRDLEKTPRPYGAKPFKQLKPPVFVYQFTAQYRIRVGDYRILYDVDDKQKIVWIFALRKRNEKTYK